MIVTSVSTLIQWYSSPGKEGRNFNPRAGTAKASCKPRAGKDREIRATGKENYQKRKDLFKGKRRVNGSHHKYKTHPVSSNYHRSNQGASKFYPGISPEGISSYVPFLEKKPNKIPSVCRRRRSSHNNTCPTLIDCNAGYPKGGRWVEGILIILSCLVFSIIY